MNKKILIGGIIAVAILVGVSFTSVVGYQSVESNFRESPLFNIRASRVTERDGNGVTSDYVGKGIGSDIFIPNRDQSNIQLQKCLESISNMDSTSLSKLIESISKNNLKNIKPADIIEKLNFLNSNIKYLNNPTKEELTFVYTYIHPCTVDGHWQLGCFINMILLNILVGIIILMVVFIPTMNPAVSMCTMNAACQE